MAFLIPPSPPCFFWYLLLFQYFAFPSLKHWFVLIYTNIKFLLKRYFYSLLLNFQVYKLSSDKLEEGKLHHIGPLSKCKAKSLNKLQENCTHPQITAAQYASRNAMLWSLAVAWSPLLHLSSKLCSIPQVGSSVSLLAVGGKSGKISLWRIYVPECYSIEHSRVPTANIVGLLEAHNSWITSISWAFLTSDSSNPQVLLATGSSDGR